MICSDPRSCGAAAAVWYQGVSKVQVQMRVMRPGRAGDGIDFSAILHCADAGTDSALGFDHKCMSHSAGVGKHLFARHGAKNIACRGPL